MARAALSAGKFWGLRRLADTDGRFKMLAVDQRPPIKKVTAAKRGESEARAQDVRDVKRVLIETLGRHATAVLADPTHALTNALTLLEPAHGLIVTLEDSLFEETPTGRLSAEIRDWNVDKIKRVGADAVKVLAWYRPDQDTATRTHQQDFVKRTGDACARLDIPFLLELLVYPLPGARDHHVDYAEQPEKQADHVLDSVAHFAAASYGVDLFKLESPLPASAVPAPHSAGSAACQALFDQLGEAAGRPWVMLSAGAAQGAFRSILHYAYTAGASGYLAGRAIWWDAFQIFPDLDVMHQALATGAADYMRDLNRLTDAEARPWTTWFEDGRPALADAPDFAHAYGAD